MLLAAHTAGSPHLGWYVGLIIGFAVVLVVVVAVASILTSASRINDQARQAIEAVDLARERTGALWDASRIRRHAGALLDELRASGDWFRRGEE
jgi:hypothetical protein